METKEGEEKVVVPTAVPGKGAEGEAAEEEKRKAPEEKEKKDAAT